jgi:hypothetical protein
VLIGVALRALARLGLWCQIADAAGLPAFVPLLLYGVIMVVIPLTDVSGALLAAKPFKCSKTEAGWFPN